MGKVIDYFFGTDMIKFYKDRKEKFPDDKRRLNREFLYYYGFGKVLPNVADISCLGLVAFGHPFSGVITLGLGEGIRSTFGGWFENKKIEYSFNDVGNKFNKLKDIYEKKSSK